MIDDLMQRLARFRKYLVKFNNPADFNGVEYFKIDAAFEKIVDEFDKTFPEVE